MKNKDNTVYSHFLIYPLKNYLENIILKNSVLNLTCNLVVDEDLDLLKILILTGNQNIEYLSYFTSLSFYNKEKVKQIENAIYFAYKDKLPSIIYNNKKYKLINISKISNTSLSLGLYLEHALLNNNIKDKKLAINKNDNHYIKLTITRSNSKLLNIFIKNLKRDYTNLYLEINKGIDPNLIFKLYYKISKLILDESLSLKNQLNKIV